MTGTPIDRLRRSAGICQASGDADLIWLADGIDRVLASDGEASLDDVLGLHWAARLGVRNEKIRETYRRHFSASPPYTAAGEITRIARGLQARGVKIDQIGVEDPRRLIAEALNTGLRFPKKRQLSNILSLQ